MDYVKAAPADGSTLLFTPDFLFTIFPNTYRKLSYDAVRDFTPVASVSRAGLALSVGPLVPAGVRTVADFVQWCKANPGRAAYASSGAGGIFHLLGVMFAQAHGIEMTHVPYKGGAPALTDLVGGQIAASFNGIGEVLPYVRDGKVRTLATFGPKRSLFLPDVPTMVELGRKDFVVASWLGVFAPARTPGAAVARLNQEIGRIVESPEFTATVEKLSMEPLASSQASFAELVKADMERWAPVVKASGFTAED